MDEFDIDAEKTLEIANLALIALVITRALVKVVRRSKKRK